MTIQPAEARARLNKAHETRGELARIARDSGVTYRTLYNIINESRAPSAETLKKLAAQFRRDDRRTRA